MPNVQTDLPTVCVLCSHNCGLRVDVEDGRIVAVRGDETNPITHGLRLQQGLQHRALRRARRPHPAPDAAACRRQLRADRLGRRRSREIAAKLGRHPRARTRRARSPSSASAARATTWTRPTPGFLRGLGSRRWFNAFAQEKTQHNLLDQWMFDASPATFLHADTARTHASCSSSAPTRRSRTAATTRPTPSRSWPNDPTRTVVVVDPRETETTRTATPPPAGCDPAPTRTCCSRWRR